MDEKKGDCFTLFFNLIVSQLFIGAISSLIELIRIFAVNILTKYFLSEAKIQRYGIYIQPVITCLLLLFIGIIFYSVYKNIGSSGDCVNINLPVAIFWFIVVFIVLLLFAPWMINRFSKMKD